MGITVFRNGSLARERVRDRFGLDWEGVGRALQETPPGNDGIVMLPWFEPEITPPVFSPGVRRYDLSETDAAANVRAVVEGQMIAMALHSRWMGLRPEVIHATGGASANREILQVMADAFDAAVRVLPATNSAALGAALRAYHADALADGVALDWTEVVCGFTEPLPDRVEPIAAHVEIYRRQMRRQSELENAEIAPRPPR
jgi:xylulokinase